MFGINVTEYDKFIYEEYLRDFLPDRMIDIHVHIWKEGTRKETIASTASEYPLGSHEIL